MKRSNPLRTLTLAVVCAAIPGIARGQVIDFEGLQDFEEILEYYNGGTGSLGSTGFNYGISFSAGALALIDSDDGGFGEFENNQGSTVAFFLSSNLLTMNVLNGFTGLSFLYSAAAPAFVDVWSGLNATGTLLASLSLTPQFDTNCPPYAPGRTGDFCNWTAFSSTFAGTAMSVDFGGSANEVGFDSITLTSASTDVVPEPITMILLGTGLAGLGAARQRRRRT